VLAGFEPEVKKGIRMDFDEPMSKVDYWGELEKQVL